MSSLIDIHSHSFTETLTSLDAPMNFVIGNTGGDADSVTCALAASIILNCGKSENLYTPVLNFGTDGLEVRQDVDWWLKTGIHTVWEKDSFTQGKSGEDIKFKIPTYLSYNSFKEDLKARLSEYDTIKMDYKTKSSEKNNFNIVLVDHNELDARQTFFNQAVREVFDHHNHAQIFVDHQQIEYHNSESFTSSASSVIAHEIHKRIAKLNNGGSTYNLQEKQAMLLMWAPYLIDSAENPFNESAFTDIFMKEDFNCGVLTGDHANDWKLEHRMLLDATLSALVHRLEEDVATEKRSNDFNAADFKDGYLTSPSGRFVDLEFYKMSETMFNCEQMKMMRGILRKLQVLKNGGGDKKLIDFAKKDLRSVLEYDEKVYRYHEVVIPITQTTFGSADIMSLFGTQGESVVGQTVTVPVDESRRDVIKNYLNDRKAGFFIMGAGSIGNFLNIIVKHPDSHTIIQGYMSERATPSPRFSSNDFACQAYGLKVYQIVYDRMTTGSGNVMDFTGTRFAGLTGKNKVILKPFSYAQNGGFFQVTQGKYSRKQAASFWYDLMNYLDGEMGKERTTSDGASTFEGLKLFSVHDDCVASLRSRGTAGLPSFVGSEESYTEIDSFMGTLRF